MAFRIAHQLGGEILAQRFLIKLSMARDADGYGPGQHDGQCDEEAWERLQPPEPAPIAIPHDNRDDRGDRDRRDHRPL